MTPAELLVAIAGHGLHPTALRIIQRPMGAESWQGLLAKLSGGLVLGLALHAADSGALPVTDGQRKDLNEHLTAAKVRRSSADRCLDEVVGTLDRRGIETCVLHGAATAALDYEQPDLRLYDTLHLLVAPGQRKQAVTALVEQGIVCADGAQRRPRRRRPSTYLSREGIRVIVHTSLAPRNFGGPVDAHDLFQSRITFTPRSVSLAALGREERLVAACVHVRHNEFPRNLMAQRDIVQLVLREDLSVRRVERHASSWRLEPVLAEAVQHVWETFRVPDVVPISAWSRAYRPYRRQRRRLGVHPIPGRGA